MGVEPAWKSLVDQLLERGYESPYLTRLRARYDLRRPRRTIEEEVLEEMASALSRAEDRVNVALLELELLGAAFAERPTRSRAEAFNAKRAHALRVRRDLQIHREALRFPRDPRFEAHYPVPPPVETPEGR